MNWKGRKEAAVISLIALSQHLPERTYETMKIFIRTVFPLRFEPVSPRMQVRYNTA
jgi:hypothetical protein